MVVMHDQGSASHNDAVCLILHGAIFVVLRLRPYLLFLHPRYSAAFEREPPKDQGRKRPRMPTARNTARRRKREH